ncbi:type II toxin-antitoxin system VapB family antitoxin [Methylobacterium sp. A54F]
MSITIEDPEVESLLGDLTAWTGRREPDLLRDLLLRERARLEAERARRVGEGLSSDEILRRDWNARPLVDPRPVEEILAWDENGLPA